MSTKTETETPIKIADYFQHQSINIADCMIDADHPWKDAVCKYYTKPVTLLTTLSKAGFVDWLKATYPKHALKNLNRSAEAADPVAVEAIKEGGEVAFRWIHDSGVYQSGASERTRKRILENYVKSVAEYQTL